MSETPGEVIVAARGGDVEAVGSLPLPHRREIDLEVEDAEIVVRTGAVGIYPLYLVRKSSTAVLATTQVAAAEAVGGVSVDAEAVADALSDWRRDPEATLFEEIRRIPPNTIVRFDCADGTVEEGKADDNGPWRLGDKRLGDKRLGDKRLGDRRLGDGASAGACEPGTLRELFRERLRRRGLDDASVDVGLSGGLDSSSLVGLLDDGGADPTVWMLTDGAERHAERRNAEKLIERFGLDVRRVPVEPAELPAAFPEAVRHAEGPIINARGVSIFLLHRRVAEAGASPFLSGLGSDEVFAGKPESWSVSDEGIPGFARGSRRARQVARNVLRDDWRVGESRVAPDVGFSELRRIGFDGSTRRLLFPMAVCAPASLGLDVVYPYLDPEVVAWASRLDRDQLVRDGVGKVLLREAMAPVVGESIAWQPKEPVLQPPACGDEAVRRKWTEVLAGLLSRRRLERLGSVRPEAVDELLRAYAEGEMASDHDAAVEWALMYLASMTVLVEAAT